MNIFIFWLEQYKYTTDALFLSNHPYTANHDYTRWSFLICFICQITDIENEMAVMFNFQYLQMSDLKLNKYDQFSPT